MDKLKFVFKVKSTPDGKSNFIAITSIITEDNKTFLLPEELQQAVTHKEICKITTFINIKNTIKKRHQIRSVWITLTGGMKKEYFDEEGNIIFEGQYLEEANTDKPAAEDREINAENPIIKILEKLVENQEKNKKQNIKKASTAKMATHFNGLKFSKKNAQDLK